VLSERLIIALLICAGHAAAGSSNPNRTSPQANQFMMLVRWPARDVAGGDRSLCGLSMQKKMVSKGSLQTFNRPFIPFPLVQPTVKGLANILIIVRAENLKPSDESANS